MHRCLRWAACLAAVALLGCGGDDGSARSAASAPTVDGGEDGANAINTGLPNGTQTNGNNDPSMEGTGQRTNPRPGRGVRTGSGGGVTPTGNYQGRNI